MKIIGDVRKVYHSFSFPPASAADEADLFSSSATSDSKQATKPYLEDSLHCFDAALIPQHQSERAMLVLLRPSLLRKPKTLLGPHRHRPRGRVARLPLERLGELRPDVSFQGVREGDVSEAHAEAALVHDALREGEERVEGRGRAARPKDGAGCRSERVFL